MIKLQELTPEIYYKQSRDFQFIGRLFDLVLNSVKTNADMIYDIPASDSAGSKMIDLLALTLGFKAKHNYTIKQLSAICGILPTILKNKGTLYAIKTTCQTILTAEGITEQAEVSADWTAGTNNEPFKVTIYVPPMLSDLSLLLDLLSYILPAGISCELRKIGKISTPNPTTAIKQSFSYESREAREYEYDDAVSELVGVSTIARGTLSGFDNKISTEATQVVTDKDYDGPITNSTVVRGGTNNE